MDGNWHYKLGNKLQNKKFCSYLVYFVLVLYNFISAMCADIFNRNIEMKLRICFLVLSDGHVRSVLTFIIKKTLVTCERLWLRVKEEAAFCVSKKGEGDEVGQSDGIYALGT